MSDPDFDSNESEWTSLKQATVALHEMFTTMMDSGFTEIQALRLISFIVEDMGQSFTVQEIDIDTEDDE